MVGDEVVDGVEPPRRQQRLVLGDLGRLGDLDKGLAGAARRVDAERVLGRANEAERHLGARLGA